MSHISFCEHQFHTASVDTLSTPLHCLCKIDSQYVRTLTFAEHPDAVRNNASLSVLNSKDSQAEPMIVFVTQSALAKPRGSSCCLLGLITGPLHGHKPQKSLAFLASWIEKLKQMSSSAPCLAIVILNPRILTSSKHSTHWIRVWNVESLERKVFNKGRGQNVAHCTFCSLIGPSFFFFFYFIWVSSVSKAHLSQSLPSCGRMNRSQQVWWAAYSFYSPDPPSRGQRGEEHKSLHISLFITTFSQFVEC